MLIDSNIIIYATQPQHTALRNFIAQHSPVVSAISYVEVLGYHRLSTTDKEQLEIFFSAVTILPITQPILDRAVNLRQQRKMTLGDALIAATCLEHELTLHTHNTVDFQWIPDLVVVDPLAITSDDSAAV